MIVRKTKSIVTSVLFAALFVAAGIWGCLPGSTALLIDKITNCDEGDNPITEGLLDVQVAEAYVMKVYLINMLTQTASTAEFRAEANFIDVKEIHNWFEVENKNIKIPLDPTFFPTKQKPYVVKVFLPLRPELAADFTGAAGVGGGGGTTATALPQSSPLSFQLIPPTMVSAWKKVVPNILKANGLKRLRIISHIKFVGYTRAGYTITSQEITFPIYICDNCLNNQDPKKPAPACVTTSPTGRCVGQDGICKDTTGQGGEGQP